MNGILKIFLLIPKISYFLFQNKVQNDEKNPTDANIAMKYLKDFGYLKGKIDEAELDG